MPKPSRYRGSNAERLALSTYLKLTRASEGLWNRLAPGLQRADLTPSQFGVLEALYHLGPMHQCDLGERILKSSGNMTLVIDNLEKRGAGPARALARGPAIHPGAPDRRKASGSSAASSPVMPTRSPGSWPSSPRRSSVPWETSAGSWE